MTSTDEPSLNVAMAEVLDNMRHAWRVSGQPSGRPLDRGRPDITITENGVSPVVIENEFLPASTVEIDATKRLGATHKGYGEISTVIAIRVPKRLKKFQGENLRKELRNARDLEYCVYSPDRFPESGWIIGSLANISMAAQVMATPKEKIDECIEILEKSILRVATQIKDLNESARNKIANELQQEATDQTWKMVGLILSNAIVFYDSISNKDGIKTIAELKNHSRVSQSAIIDAWDRVLEIDYYAIFEIARRILKILDMDTASKVIDNIVKAAEEVIGLGMTRSFDLYGSLFQKTIADRKLLAAFYTLPESAALLASILVPHPDEDMWNESKLKKFKTADFTCGTGTLLTHIYKKMTVNYEINGHSMSKIHPAMMESCIIGYDIIPLATHLTVSAMASTFPHRSFDKTSIHRLKFGVKDGICNLGSLDLIDDDPTLPVAGSRVMAKGEEDIMHPGMEVANNSCSLIAMNPPFGRNTNHEGEKKDLLAPIFAVFGIPTNDQELMKNLMKKKFDGTCHHGNAGLGSSFVAIANKKLAKKGVMGFILPSTVAHGSSWSKVRELIAKRYEDIKIISIANSESSDTSFSSDTSMSEVILVAKKQAKKSSNVPRGKFVSLYERPRSIIESFELGNAILAAGDIRRLEDGPHGGTPLQIGNKTMGKMLDGPVDIGWMFVNVIDPVIAQCAYKLREGILDLPHQKAHNLNITAFGDVVELGPLHRDISGSKLRGPFNMTSIERSALYPALWANNNKKQTSIIVEPDKMGAPKPDAEEEKIQKIWNSASHTHVNLDASYISQALCFAYTLEKTMGGSAWPTVILDEKYEKSLAVWGISTLGILSHWCIAGKQQPGRGRTTRTSITSMPVLDFAKLKKNQIKSLDKIFDEYATEKLLPMRYLYKDKTRIEIDENLLDILDINASLGDLRKRFCKEPSVNGGKLDADLKNTR